jgi:uncharacterized OsmC-like protein
MENTARKQDVETVNGINVTALQETVGAIKAKPALAAFAFKAENQWKGGSLNRTTFGDFYGALTTQKRPKPFVTDNDEPEVLLGADSSPNPVEWLLHALAGCLTSSMAYHAAARGIEIKGIQSTYDGKIDLHGFLGLDPKVRKGYQAIEVAFKVKTDASPDEIRACALQSPVFEMVSASVPVNLKIETAN